MLHGFSGLTTTYLTIDSALLHHSSPPANFLWRSLFQCLEESHLHWNSLTCRFPRWEAVLFCRTALSRFLWVEFFFPAGPGVWSLLLPFLRSCVFLHSAFLTALPGCSAWEVGLPVLLHVGGGRVPASAALPAWRVPSFTAWRLFFSFPAF